MPEIVRRIALSRRTVLRGLGASVALPFLDAMTPTFAAPDGPSAAAARPTRLVFVYTPNGMTMPDWTPGAEGELGALPHLLEPLAAAKSEIAVLSGLTLDGARAHADGPGDHARAAGAYLTGVHPKKTGGADLRAAMSVDQIAAAKIGETTSLRSLELGLEPGALAGECDSGYSCAYTNNLSWLAPSTPLVKTVDPRQAFDRLFGGDDALLSPEERARRAEEDASVLDFALTDAKRLREKLGASDRRKLDEYLSAVREVEKRIRQAAKAEDAGGPGVASGFARPGAPPKDVAEHLAVMYDLVLLAVATDRTRVVTFMLGNEGSNRSYPFLGVPDAHHAISHHGRDPEKVAKIRKINRWQMDRFAEFVEKLRKAQDGDAPLLDRTIVVFGSGIADGDRHDHHDLPILVAGGRAAGLRLGRHVRSAKETPLANLWLRLLDAVNVRVPSFGDSTGRLSAV